MSRDRHKFYVDELQNKLKEMEKRLEGQLCLNCRAALTDTSSISEEEEPMHLNPGPTGLPLLDPEPQLDDLPLLREHSNSDPEWGNIGRYFCLVFFCLAVAFISSSVQPPLDAPSQKQVSRLLTANDSGICSKSRSPGGGGTPHSLATTNTVVPSALRGLQMP
jgi:hypothetical protein